MEDLDRRLPFNSEGVCSIPNAEAITILTTLIKERLSQYFGDEINYNNFQVTGKVLCGQELSRLIRLQIRSDRGKERPDIFVKMCPEWTTMNPAKLEYETLRLLHSELPLIRPDCGVARPLDFFPELNAYAMESVGENSLKPFLLRHNSRLQAASSLKELYLAITKSAIWLSTFHRVTQSPEGKRFNHEVFVASPSEEFDYHCLRDFGFKKTTIIELERLIEEMTMLDGLFELPCAKWHWDFTPAHVFFGKDKIFVIDILGYDDVPIYEDIGHFLAAMGTVNNFPFHPLYDRHRANEELAYIFTKAYQVESSQNESDLFLLANIYKLKYLVNWFFAQHTRVSNKLGELGGKIFTLTRLIRVFEPPILHTISKIKSQIRAL